MPGRAGIGQADVATVFLDVGDQQDLRLVRQTVFREAVEVRFAQHGGEFDLAGGRDGLVAKHHHAVGDECGEDRGFRRRVERQGQVHAPDFRPAGVARRQNLHAGRA